MLIHANAVNTLLSGAFFADLTLPQRGLTYLALATLVCFAGMFCPQRWVFVTLPAVLALYLGAAVVCFLGYLILPVVGGAASVVLSSFGTFVYRHYVQDREKRQLRKLFQRYLQPEIVDRLLNTQDADFFKGESLRLCVLFSDIRGFTTYSEKRAPAEVVQRLNQYFEAMAQEVAAHGGIVDKFLGDGLLAFFGALEPGGNPSMEGVKASLGMMRRLETLNREWAARGEETFRIGVGLHTGLAMAGNIGSQNKTEFTVIGDTVNLASRLQDKTKELGVPLVVSETVYDEVKDVVDAEEKGMVQIKGRSPVTVYHIKGLRRES